MYKNVLVLLFIAVLLTACNVDIRTGSSHSDMSFREAEKAGFVTSGPGGIANMDKLETFHNSFNNKQNSKLTIVHYTDEGDPVYLDLDYDGQTIKYVRDTSWDAFGGQNKGVKETTCNMISKRTGSYGFTYGTEYFLSDCKADIGFSDPEKEEYYLLLVEEEVTEKEAEQIVNDKINKPITITSITKKENRFEVKWEYKSNCEAGTEYIDIKTGEHMAGQRSIC